MRSHRLRLRVTITFLAATLFFAMAAHADHHLITFDDQPVAPTVDRHDVTIGNVTFRKGAIEDLINDPFWTSRCYFTASTTGAINPKFDNAIYIEFAQPASNISLDLEQGLVFVPFDVTGPVHFTVYDEHGNTKEFDMPLKPATGNPVNIVRGFQWPYSNVHALTVLANTVHGNWNFSIDNVSYDDDACAAVAAQDTTRPQCDLERLVIAIDGDTDAAGHQLFHTQNVSPNMKLNVPIGARLSITMQRRNAQGQYAPINSSFEWNAPNIGPPLPARFNAVPYNVPLYQYNVVGVFVQDAHPYYSAMRRVVALHGGNQTILIKPNDRPVNDPATQVLVTVYFPTTLGKPGVISRLGLNNVTKYDGKLIGFAHERGIPPQFFKGQIEQETLDSRASYFDPKTWRYEPITVDYAQHAQPGSPEWQGYSLPNGSKLVPADISPRAPLVLCNGAGYSPIGPSDTSTMPTARQLFDANNHINTRQNWDSDLPDPSPRPPAPCGTPPPPPPPGRHRAVGPVPDLLGFTAQTPLASSYGLLQVVHQYVFGGPFYWRGANGRFNPSLLFDTDENLALDDQVATATVGAAAGSLRIGANKDLFLVHVFENPELGFPGFNYGTDVDYDDDIKDAFDHYSGTNGVKYDYGLHVVTYAQDYLPQLRGDVFTTSCAPPVVASQSESASIAAGDVTTLGFNLTSPKPAAYDWYVVDGGSRTRVDGSDPILVVRPTRTTTYVAVATNDCGSVTSAPITVVVSAQCNKPVIVAQPSATLAATTATLTVATSATDATYQWVTADVNLGAAVSPNAGTLVPGGGKASVTVSRSGTASAYQVIIRNSCGVVMSSPVTVDAVIGCPVITQASASSGSGIVAPATPVLLNVTATGNSLTYQWFRADKVPIGNSVTVTVSPTTTTSYYVIVSNSCGQSQSALVTVTVDCSVPVIINQPVSTNTTAGSPANLSLGATGATGIQWFVSGGTAVGTGASITVTPAITTTYYAVASNACGSATSGTVTVTVTASCTPPSITTQPFASAVGSATLTVSASGTSPLTYSWFTSDGSPAGSGPSIAVSPSTTTSYYARAVNACGTATSNTSTVIVAASCTPPSITAQPLASAEGSATLTVSASGSSPLTYSWFTLDGSPIGSGPAITVSPSTTTSYYARASNACGTATSNIATVTVTSSCVPPSISVNPQGQSIPAGGAATLSVSAAGTFPVAIGWFTSDGSPVASGLSITVFPSVTTSYYAIASNACGQTQSASATITVTPICSAPAINAQPQPQTISVGSSANLTAGASGTQPLLIQWFTSTGSPVGNGTSVLVTPAATTTYFATVSNSCGSAQTQFVTITVVGVCSLPAITQQPASTSVIAGLPASLTVQAGGTPPLTYQWYAGFSGDTTSPLIGETSPTLTVAPMDTTTFWVRVTSTCGTASSAGATIIVVLVCESPVILGEPASQSIASGDAVTLNVDATGSPTLAFQWYVGTSGDTSNPVPGATLSHLTFTPAASESVWVEITNACGVAASASATITVTPTCAPAQVAGQPSSIGIIAGQAGTLQLTASGSSPLTIQWYRGASGDRSDPVLDATGPALTVTPAATTTYWAYVTNSCGTASTVSATISVTSSCTGPAVSQQPIGSTISLGDTATLSVTADGTAPLSYQWYIGQSGDTHALLGSGSTIAVTPSQTTTYWARVTNGCGTTDSNAATITIACDAPVIIASPQPQTIAVGGSATLTTTVSGTSPSFQWYAGASGNTTSSVPGATGSTLTIAPAATTSYWVLVTTPCGTAASDAAIVTVTCSGCGGDGGPAGGGGPQPFLNTRPPAPVGVAAVSKAHHTITVSWRPLSGPASYQVWRFKAGRYVPIATTHATTFQDEDVLPAVWYTYFVVSVTNGVVSAQSLTASTVAR